jgi:flagellar biosynthesis regulator FlaF
LNAFQGPPLNAPAAERLRAAEAEAQAAAGAHAAAAAVAYHRAYRHLRDELATNERAVARADKVVAEAQAEALAAAAAVASAREAHKALELKSKRATALVADAATAPPDSKLSSTLRLSLYSRAFEVYRLSCSSLVFVVDLFAFKEGHQTADLPIHQI